MNTISEEVALLHDPNAERRALVRAIYRVADAGLYEHEDAIRALTKHPIPDVRAEAIRCLLSPWNRTDMIDTALQVGLHDPNEYLRGEVYIGLGSLMRVDRTIDPALVRKALVAMAAVVIKDPDWTVQAGAYYTFLEILGKIQPGESLPERFDRDRHVDWGLIEQYRDEAQALDYTLPTE